MTYAGTFDDGALARCCTREAPGDLGDVWDTAPDAIEHILDGPRTLDVAIVCGNEPARERERGSLV